MESSTSSKYQPKTTNLLGNPVHHFVKPGLPDWAADEVSAELLSKAAITFVQPQNIALFADTGVLLAALAPKILSASFTVLSTNLILANCAQQTLQANKIQHCEQVTGYSLLPQHQNCFDLILMPLPKGRRLARRWLLEAFYLLRPQGSLLLAGSNPMGIQSVVRDGELLFGNFQVLAYKKGHRVARFVKQTGIPDELEWVKTPGIAPSSWIQFSAPVYNKEFQIYSLPGIFSEDHLDEGSALLIDSLDVSGYHYLLDAGCGYGILGLAAVERSRLNNQPVEVDLVDIDFAALAACQKTMQVHEISNAAVFASDLYSQIGKRQYDLIFSNPPFHTGKRVNYTVARALITQAYQALRTGGRLMLVANRFIRYEKIIQEIFHNYKICAQNNHFHVISAEK